MKTSLIRELTARDNLYSKNAVIIAEVEYLRCIHNTYTACIRLTGAKVPVDITDKDLGTHYFTAEQILTMASAPKKVDATKTTELFCGQKLYDRSGNITATVHTEDDTGTGLWLLLNTRAKVYMQPDELGTVYFTLSQIRFLQKTLRIPEVEERPECPFLVGQRIFTWEAGNEQEFQGTVIDVDWDARDEDWVATLFKDGNFSDLLTASAFAEGCVVGNRFCMEYYPAS